MIWLIGGVIWLILTVLGCAFFMAQGDRREWEREKEMVAIEEDAWQ